jgi:hypothetical protein
MQRRDTKKTRSNRENNDGEAEEEKNEESKGEHNSKGDNDGGINGDEGGNEGSNNEGDDEESNGEGGDEESNDEGGDEALIAVDAEESAYAGRVLQTEYELMLQGARREAEVLREKWTSALELIEMLERLNSELADEVKELRAKINTHHND